MTTCTGFLVLAAPLALPTPAAVSPALRRHGGRTPALWRHGRRLRHRRWELGSSPQSQRSHGRPDERILGAGELEDEGMFPLAVRFRPRLTCDIEALTRGRKGVGIHPAEGEPTRRVRETSCCLGSDPI